MTHAFATSMLNKRVALIGLANEEAYAISDALSQAYAMADRVSSDAARAGLNALAPYHASIVDASAIDAEGSVSGIPLAEIEHREVLAIAAETTLRESEFAWAHLKWELIVRPFTGAELLMRLSRLLCRAEQRVSPAQPDRNRRRVLIVDDDKTVHALLSAVLEAAGFWCDCVSNATEALAALAGRHHDLVMLDLGLPEIDGFRVLKALRSNAPARNPAVIILTSATREEDIVRGFKLGADDYVTKPFNPRELVARCERAIRGRGAVSGGIRGLAARTQGIAAGN
jgi:DNA-binding response OmpR family regulator